MARWWPVTERYETADAAECESGLAAATLAVQRGELIVFPTDTVYGVGADAFDPASVRRLLAAKGRGREMPPPVLVSAPGTLDALAVGVPSYARSLIEELWPGPLTLICKQQPSLQWDLGDTRGTVAVRMPDHRIALDLLSRTGPLAVSSANRTGMAAATDADDAESMLGESVAVILDDGKSPGPVSSTIIDATDQNTGHVLRRGAVLLERLNEIVAPLGSKIVDEG